ncbi:MAG TPA: 2,4'-dihydroxyacetophenone dioxygenase family protein [Steroidobacteraceae bacterium]|nr:2,4'-dihydroxyacetophenone dioxygenase family protein [Steroidobacteraceae bacterium]
MTAVEELHAFEVNESTLPWFDYAPGVQMKLLKINRSTGQFVLLLRAEPGAHLGRHKHYGTVNVYTLRGRWRYLEDPWTATAGSYIHEPAGAIHTFEADKDEGLLVFLVVDGCLEFLDDQDRSIGIDNWQSLLQRYVDHCTRTNTKYVDISL